MNTELKSTATLPTIKLPNKFSEIVTDNNFYEYDNNDIKNFLDLLNQALETDGTALVLDQLSSVAKEIQESVVEQKEEHARVINQIIAYILSKVTNHDPFHNLGKKEEDRLHSIMDLINNAESLEDN